MIWELCAVAVTCFGAGYLWGGLREAEKNIQAATEALGLDLQQMYFHQRAWQDFRARGGVEVCTCTRCEMTRIQLGLKPASRWKELKVQP